MKFFLLSLLVISSAYGIDWQGHRGARGLYPENTIGAMEEALKYPVTTLELDVVISKDQKIVVSHEPWMSEEICLDADRKKIKDRKFNIYKLNYEEIQKFDCGTLPHPRFPEQKKISVGKPLLTDLITVTEEKLKELNRSEIPYNIEIKSLPEDEKDGFQPDVKTFSDLVVLTLKKQLSIEKFTIQSFDWRVLKYINKTYPEVRLVALIEGRFRPSEVISELGFRPYVFSPYFKHLDKKDVKAFHEMNIKVIPWTVNEVEDMKKVKKMGVDGIITDYPNRIEEASAKKCKEGQTFFEDKCIDVPKNAVSSPDIPGWDCGPGYVQKRMKCRAIVVPKNGRLTEDGKDWICNDGFRRYRSKCVK